MYIVCFGCVENTYERYLMVLSSSKKFRKEKNKLSSCATKKVKINYSSVPNIIVVFNIHNN